MMKNKTKVLLIVLISMLFFVGWGKKQIELLDDKKLIDLAVAIEYAKPGGDLEQNEDISNETKESEESQNDAEANMTDKENIQEGEKDIVISIHDQAITYDGQSVESVEKLEEYIRRDNGENVCFVVVEDWAESHRYKEVVKTIKMLKSELGITCSTE